MEKHKLLPCPFCASEYVGMCENGIGDYYVVCSGCEARTSDRHCEIERHAAERWNERGGNRA